MPLLVATAMVVSLCGRLLLTPSLPKDVLAAVGTGDDEIHQNQHQIVMPARCLFSPETRVPNKDFLLNGSQHDQNQTDGCELGEYTKRNTEAASQLRHPKKNRKRRRHVNIFSPLLWILQVCPSAGNKDSRDHQSQQQQAEVSEFSELWKHAACPPGQPTFGKGRASQFSCL